MYDVKVPCDLHEMTGCSICSGLDKKLAKEDAPVDIMTLGSPPPGHAWAQWPGKCAGCGTAYEIGEPIRFSRSANGWVPAVCC